MVGTAMPEDVRQAASAADLGAGGECHPFRAGKGMVLGAFWVVLSAVPIGLLVAFGREAPWPINALLGVFAAFALIGGLSVLVDSYRQRGQRLYVFEGGLVHDFEQRAPEVFAWRDTTVRRQHTVYRRGGKFGTSYTAYTYFLTRADGRKLNFSNEDLDGLIQWGGRIMDDAARARLPGAVAKLNAGQTLTFGPFSVTAQTVGDGRQVLPWAQVEQVWVRDGMIALQGPTAGKQPRRLIGHQVDQVADLGVFLTLADLLRPRTAAPE